MNFIFLNECEMKDSEMKQEYEDIYRDLEEAESIYWGKPDACGALLRRAAEKICCVYNRYYQVGFKEGTSLEEFLCYTADDAHNEMVSHFLSAIRKEQRDRLNKLRVFGDDCILGKEAPKQAMSFEDRMSQNAERMMDVMMEVLKEMCKSINGRNDLKDCCFDANTLPGRQEEPSVEEPEERKKSFLAKILKRKK